MDNEKTIAEINEVIASVEAGLERDCEIGARDKMTLKGLLRANNINKNIKYFPCKRENSAKIVAHFVRVKGIPQSRFSINAQPGIFILCDAGAEGTAHKEDEDRPSERVRKVERGESEVKVQKKEKAAKESKVRKEEKARKEVKVQKQEKTPKKGTARKATTAKKGKGRKGK